MQDVRTQQNVEKKGLSLFRRSKAPSRQDTTDSTKKGRFSLFRNTGRRSGLVLDQDAFPHPKGGSPVESESSSSESSSSGRRSDGSGEDVNDERNRALSILEGRAQSQPQSPTNAAPPPGSDPATPIASSQTLLIANQPQASPIPSPMPSPVPPPSPGRMSTILSRRSTANSVASRRSLSGDDRDQRRASSRLGQVPENSTTPLSTTEFTFEVDEHGLPTYDSAAYPSRPVTYRFTQSGPFAMTIAGDEEEVPGLGRYHVSVGLNVWAPRSCVTSVRRGQTEDGPLVAQLESECSSFGASITMGDVSKLVKEVITKSIMNGSRTYNIGDGVAIQWKLGRTQWKAFLDGALIAQFTPTTPRTLIVQPVAHKYLDHILLAVLLLMRDKDDAGSRPDSYGGQWVAFSTVGAFVIDG